MACVCKVTLWNMAGDILNQDNAGLNPLRYSILLYEWISGYRQRWIFVYCQGSFV